MSVEERMQPLCKINFNEVQLLQRRRALENEKTTLWAVRLQLTMYDERASSTLVTVEGYTTHLLR